MLISVIIPARDRTALLRRAIGSVIGQTLTDWELIVVDDGSEADVAAVIERWDDPRIRLIRLPEPSGAPVARNRGVLESAGEFVTFLDSDDEYLSEKLQRQLEAITADPSLGCVMCGFVELTETRSRVRTPRDPVTYTGLLHGPQNWVTTGQLLVRSSLARQVRFDEALPAYQDWDLLVRLADSTHIGVDPEPLLLKHEHTGSRIYSGARKHEAVITVRSKYRSQVASSSETDLAWHIRIAIAHTELGQIDQARREIADAIRKYPTRLGLYLWYLAGVSRPTLRVFLRIRYRTRRVRRYAAELPALFKGPR